MSVKRCRKGARVFEGGSEGVVVLGLAVDAGGRRVDVVEMAFEVCTRVIARGKVVVGFEELLVLDNVGGVTIDRSVFVCAYVPDGGSGAVRSGGGGDRGGCKVDRDVAIKLGHGVIKGTNHLIYAGGEQGVCRGRHRGYGQGAVANGREGETKECGAVRWGAGRGDGGVRKDCDRR